ncbi:T-cell activation inhibitor, mitochondrial-like [Rhopilema esculentum]|uniref:T-cell activation inhibitor, mitochondrial-like n=1 Tax=Rhopilema esculentum TaxID=499914 RepID=UPI0031D99B50
MLQRFFIKLQRRKLLVASTIVAVRSFTSQIDDYGAALKQFYFAVHPDFFEQHPAEKEVNQNSLKVLNHFLREVNLKQDVKPVTVKFFLREKKLAESSQDSIHGQFTQVHIRLRSRHFPTLVHDILSKCHLPIHKDLESLVKKQEERRTKQKPNKIRWSSTLMDWMDEEMVFSDPVKPVETLRSWLVKNTGTARIRLNEMSPIVDENRRISKRMIRRHKLKGFVDGEMGYSQTTLNGALKQMEYLFKRRTINSKGLFGRTLKLGVFNGLDHLGRFIIDITDVPSAWLQGLSSINDFDGLVPVLDLTEMQISEQLQGLQISRSRTHDPVPIKLYYKQASKLLCSLRESRDFDTMVTPLMNRYRARVTSATEDLSIDPDGVIVVPCLTTSDAISSFLRLNHRQILEARKTHARSLQAELNTVQSCKEVLNLSSMRKDRIISSEQMIKSCERLKREGDLGLDSLKLIISNYYGISGDGEIRIPWQWKR